MLQPLDCMDLVLVMIHASTVVRDAVLGQTNTPSDDSKDLFEARINSQERSRIARSL